MKAKKNILYYTVCNNHTRLIKENSVLSQDAFEIELSNNQSRQLANILDTNISRLQHRCISVYRDAFVYAGDIYNVCLSCGDFYRNNTVFFLSDEGIKKFKEFKCSLIDNGSN